MKKDKVTLVICVFFLLFVAYKIVSCSNEKAKNPEKKNEVDVVEKPTTSTSTPPSDKKEAPTPENPTIPAPKGWTLVDGWYVATGGTTENLPLPGKFQFFLEEEGVVKTHRPVILRLVTFPKEERGEREIIHLLQKWDKTLWKKGDNGNFSIPISNDEMLKIPLFEIGCEAYNGKPYHVRVKIE